MPMLLGVHRNKEDLLYHIDIVTITYTSLIQKPNYIWFAFIVNRMILSCRTKYESGNSAISLNIFMTHAKHFKHRIVSSTKVFAYCVFLAPWESCQVSPVYPELQILTIITLRKTTECVSWYEHVNGDNDSHGELTIRSSKCRDKITYSEIQTQR